ncbi:uncharacterized protein B0H18DRAFT_960546 [Fomitopsis serialis]|uniref:uncharacterized protein n=1 Tax=Fomitopsis serialis TaxID=139415 RepID=UPI0020087CC2|nr:uncharacterized protein B0H18DRAFT_960546 [Neoantrodia serialis]KAH9913180.1 hypothetical protein B0H18DRAFT_960546 [Neoantrodia serialis]
MSPRIPRCLVWIRPTDNKFSAAYHGANTRKWRPAVVSKIDVLKSGHIAGFWVAPLTSSLNLKLCDATAWRAVDWGRPDIAVPGHSYTIPFRLPLRQNDSFGAVASHVWVSDLGQFFTVAQWKQAVTGGQARILDSDVAVSLTQFAAVRTQLRVLDMVLRPYRVQSKTMRQEANIPSVASCYRRWLAMSQNSTVIDVEPVSSLGSTERCDVQLSLPKFHVLMDDAFGPGWHAMENLSLSAPAAKSTNSITSDIVLRFIPGLRHLRTAYLPSSFASITLRRTPSMVGQSSISDLRNHVFHLSPMGAEGTRQRHEILEDRNLFSDLAPAPDEWNTEVFNRLERTLWAAYNSPLTWRNFELLIRCHVLTPPWLRSLRRSGQEQNFPVLLLALFQWITVDPLIPHDAHNIRWFLFEYYRIRPRVVSSMASPAAHRRAFAPMALRWILNDRIVVHHRVKRLSDVRDPTDLVTLITNRPVQLQVQDDDSDSLELQYLVRTSGTTFDERECPGRGRCPKGNRVRNYLGRACELVPKRMFQHTPPSEASECSRALPAVRHPALPQAQILVFSQSSSSGTHSNTPTSGRYDNNSIGGVLDGQFGGALGGRFGHALGGRVRQRFGGGQLSFGPVPGGSVRQVDRTTCGGGGARAAFNGGLTTSASSRQVGRRRRRRESAAWRRPQSIGERQHTREVQQRSERRAFSCPRAFCGTTFDERECPGRGRCPKGNRVRNYLGRACELVPKRMFQHICHFACRRETHYVTDTEGMPDAMAELYQGSVSDEPTMPASSNINEAPNDLYVNSDAGVYKDMDIYPSIPTEQGAPLNEQQSDFLIDFQPPNGGLADAFQACPLVKPGSDQSSWGIIHALNSFSTTTLACTTLVAQESLLIHVNSCVARMVYLENTKARHPRFCYQAFVPTKLLELRYNSNILLCDSGVLTVQCCSNLFALQVYLSENKQ